MLLALLSLLQAPAKPELEAEIRPRAWLTIAALDARGRRPFNASAVFAHYLLAAGAPPPQAGEKLTGDLGKEQAWTAVTLGDDGRLGGEWAYCAVESPSARVLMAELQGAGRLYVNGAGFAGDLYGYGFHGVPVELRAGRNDLYVTDVRGAIRLRLWTPDARVVVGDWDLTRPDLLTGRKEGLQHAGVLLMNATTETVQVQLGAGGAAAAKDALFQHGSDPGPRLAPLAVDKTLLQMLTIKPVPKEVGRAVYPLVVDGREHPFELEIRDPGSPRRITFVSRIDGSAQECSVLPSLEAPKGVVLTLHGAGVDAMNQVRSYAPKPDFVFVAPTNRRPYGFDWQDWGRLDAYEALAAALLPRREGELPLYLTGHSMGGHGTWHLAANDADRFTAIAPSAGWSSFDSYGGGTRDGELAALWRAADPSSDTLALVPNLAPIPTFVLHGEKDDNVPLAEAQRLVDALRAAGGTPTLHVQPGAGHWWDGERAAGTDCVDWPEIFELFRASKRVTLGTELEFLCIDPAIDSVHGWLQVLQLSDQARPGRVQAHLDKATSDLVLVTENVRALRFSSFPKGWNAEAVVLDGTRIVLKLTGLAQPFVRGATSWAIVPPTLRLGRQRSPEFSGPFKRAFERGFVLVYGTAGDEAEDQALLGRARCDAESWWYRGNGSTRLISDRDFLALSDPQWIYGLELGSFVPNVILYGNADTNAAWTSLLGASPPVRAKRGALRLGEREWQGDDLAAVFVAPRRDANGDILALVGAYADSGLRGTRLSYQLEPFRSGVGYPDYCLYSARILSGADAGVLAAGFYDADWQPDGRGFVRAPVPVEPSPR